MALLRSLGGWCVVVWLGAVPCVATARAQESPDEEPAAESGWEHRFGLEVRANYRRSDDNRFKTPFTINNVPVFEETVDPGAHYEFSDVTLFADVSRGDLFTVHGKLDLIDLYDRNPTSTGQKADIDEAWVRFGREPEPATLAPHSGVYLKVGKIPKFERQDYRHLQSYGLLSTAFNRFEETGAEMGFHFGRHLYLKLRGAFGNPVFLRDPNALAGDNGTPGRRTPVSTGDLNSGIAILYNAHYANFNVDGKFETGLGVGWRVADEAGRNGLDLLGWWNERKLAGDVKIHGTFYGGDLDILDGPEIGLPRSDVSLAITNDRKREAGGNVWLYLGGFSFFGQYVDQDLAGLPRTGWEAEAAWRIDLPLVWGIAGRQLFPSIAPAVRYSALDNHFRNPKLTPSPSFAWDWDKIDAGLRLGLIPGLDLTVEHSRNIFLLFNGAKKNNDEWLTTLGWRM
jgi:hypothetical protein